MSTSRLTSLIHPNCAVKRCFNKMLSYHVSREVFLCTIAAARNVTLFKKANVRRDFEQRAVNFTRYWCSFPKKLTFIRCIYVYKYLHYVSTS